MFKTISNTKKIILGIVSIPIIFISIIILWCLIDHVYSYTYYLDENIDDVEYLKPYKRTTWSEYIKDAIPIEYKKINYSVKETVEYEFNGYVLTMDIPEGFEYEEIDIQAFINAHSRYMYKFQAKR